ncbi:hypothetical protein JCM5296_007210 [Sporobolomyces johnsonii]
MGEPVELYVYDLSNGLAALWGQALTGRVVEGIWHTSLVLYGMEVWFGQGIAMKSPPGTTHHGTPRKRIPMGTTQLSKETFLEYINGIREVYQADKYHLLSFNCNTFTNDVLGFLNGSSIPADIRDQATHLMSTPFGMQMRPMIEQMFVGANTRSAGDAVNTLLPSLGITPPASASPGPTHQKDDVPSLQSVASNLQIATSAASLRATLSQSPAVAVMFTSQTCPPCNAIKPYFEELARTHGKPKHRIEFVLVETGVGGGGEIAHSAEFGGPVTATPTFVFFARGEKVGECKGADRTELETQIGMLEMAVYPPHPHSKLSLPSLSKLTRTLSPITYTSFPPLASLSSKLAASLSSCDPTTVDILTQRVIAYLSRLPTPPASASPAPFPSDLLEPWEQATLSALSSLSSPSDKFPVVDLVRLALARDHARLSSEPAFVAFIPTLIARLASDLDTDTTDAPDRAYLLTAVRLVSNTLASPSLVARVLAPDTLPNVTRLVIRALLDPDEKLRSAGAGLAWSVVARVYEARVGQGLGAGAGVESGVDDDEVDPVSGHRGGEDWEVELGCGAVLEALGREEKSVEVVHRLAATLGLLLYQSAYSSELQASLEVLEASNVLKSKEDMVAKAKEDGNEREEVVGMLKDVERLLTDSSSASASSSSSTAVAASPSSANTAFETACLDAHNTFRATHNASALTWNDTLAGTSNEWVDNCKFEHSNGTLLAGGYGENLYGISSTAYTADTPVNATAGVDAWNDEESQYNYNSPGFSEATGHFTQVVWKATKTVGCQMKMPISSAR